jgi:hypothetical protein
VRRSRAITTTRLAKARPDQKPNRFLAILPSKMAEHQKWNSEDPNGRTGANRYAGALVDVVRRQLECIAKSVADSFDKLGTHFDRERFFKQSKRLFEIHWQVLEWPESVSDVEKLANGLPEQGVEEIEKPEFNHTADKSGNAGWPSDDWILRRAWSCVAIA